MSTLRKSIALFIMIFVCIPVLIGIIWGVGITKAVVSPKFLTELPQDIIEQVPDMVDEVLEEVDREDLAESKNSRAWVRAIVASDTSIKELMRQTGLLDWLENELSSSFKRMGRMLRGEIPIRPIEVDLRPLKEALRHEAIKQYFVSLLEKLPVCTQTQMDEWAAAVGRARDIDDLPACRPADLESAATAISFVRQHEVDDIPDSFTLMEGGHSLPVGVDILKTVVSLMYLLFLIPAVGIFITALIATSDKQGILKWMGMTTLVGGVIVFALSSLVKNIIPLSLMVPEAAHELSAFEALVVGKAGTLGMMFVNHLFGGVASVAGGVCIVGIVLFALGYIVGGPETPAPAPREKKQKKTGPTAPPKQEEKVIEAEFVGESKNGEAPQIRNSDDRPLGNGDSDSNIKPKDD